VLSSFVYPKKVGDEGGLGLADLTVRVRVMLALSGSWIGGAPTKIRFVNCAGAGFVFSLLLLPSFLDLGAFSFPSFPALGILQGVVSRARCVFLSRVL
jgi:hypothetical protein